MPRLTVDTDEIEYVSQANNVRIVLNSALS